MTTYIRSIARLRARTIRPATFRAARCNVTDVTLRAESLQQPTGVLHEVSFLVTLCLATRSQDYCAVVISFTAAARRTVRTERTCKVKKYATSIRANVDERNTKKIESRR